MSRARPITRRASSRAPARRVVVVTEGAVTEPGYLRVFERLYGDRKSVRLKLIGGAGDPRAVVDCAVEESKKSKRDRLGARDSVWAMFERDEHPRFDEAKNKARGNGISLAISNPCFELWGIFHYREYDAPLHRHECQRMLGQLCSAYDRQRNKSFADSNVVKSNYRAAVERARNSLTHREEEGDPEGNPSTAVHELTECLRSPKSCV